MVKAGGMLAAASAAIADAPHVIAQPKIQWRMSTAFLPSLDVHARMADRLATIVDETSGGRFKIEVFPGGQIMQPLECFEATPRGTIQAFMAGSYYWTGKEPAVDWFSTIPFGMNPAGMAAWFYQGDGARKVHASFTKFQALVGPWDRVAEGAYHQYVAG
jgi:TRAP-type mannitol/chloroaromatic compound transport system substrate-binding protein